MNSRNPSGRRFDVLDASLNMPSLIIGCGVAALWGALSGAISSTIIGRSTFAEGMDGWPDPVAVWLGAISAALVGGGLVLQGYHDKRYFVSIITRALLVSAAIPFISLGLKVDDSLSMTVFISAGAIVLGIGSLVILAVLVGKHTKGVAILHYGVAAVVIFVFGSFLNGKQTLSFLREETRIDATFRVHRWFGNVTTLEQTSLGITDSQSSYGYTGDEFDDIDADGVVLIAKEPILIPGDISYTTSLAGQVHDTLHRFQDSSESSKTIFEGIPYLSFPTISLIACLLFMLGVKCDPLIDSSVAKYEQPLTRTVGTAALALSIVVVGSFAWQVARYRLQQSAAIKNLTKAGAVVRAGELTGPGGQVIFGSGWHVIINDPGFDDHSLLNVLKDLRQAPTLRLDLSGTGVTDDGVRRLDELDFLPMLELRETAVTADMLDDLNHVGLRYLDVRDTQIVTEDILMLQGSGIEFLLFSDEHFTDQSIPILFGFDRLKFAHIATPSVTMEGLAMFEKELEDIELEIAPSPEATSRAEVEERDEFSVQELGNVPQ